MKFGLFFLSLGFISIPLWAGHLSVNQVTKFEFIQRRLIMIESLLLSKTAELAQLETQLDRGIALSGLRQEHVLHLKKELRQLSKSLPVLKNSLQALRST